MTARSTYNAAIVSAQQAQAATVASAMVTRQEAIRAVTQQSGTVVSGNNVTGPGFGVSSSGASSIAAAEAAYQATLKSALAAYNATVDTARQTLKNSGDNDPL